MSCSLLGNKQFISEKRTKPYKWYGEGSIGRESWHTAKELWRSFGFAEKQAGEVSSS